MKPRTHYSIRRNGRHFTRRGLERYRRDLCAELRRTGQDARAERYEKMTLERFGAQGGYVIVKR